MQKIFDLAMIRSLGFGSNIYNLRDSIQILKSLFSLELQYNQKNYKCNFAINNYLLAHYAKGTLQILIKM